jgi:hypothetical protein
MKKGPYQAVVYRAPKPMVAKGKEPVRGVTRRAAFAQFFTDKRAATREVRRRTRALGVGARGNVYAEKLGMKLLHQCHAVVKHGRVTLRTDEL